MLLSIRHRTRYAYEPPATAVAMRLKLYPSVFEGQKTEGWTVRVNGRELPPEFADCWGDAAATAILRGGAEAVEIVAEGRVATTDLAGVLRGHREAMRPGVCMRATPRTKWTEEIAALAREAEGDSELARAHALCDLVADRVAYKPGSTHYGTSAAEALEAGEGVCQDQAHVMIAAARSLGWPARYVVGYYLPSPDGRDDAATHAWAEVWLAGLGWVGFDVTHRMCPTDLFVRLCAGFDAADAAPIRGHAEGAPTEGLEAEVSVAPVQSQTQTQSQS